jgi:hypothetical protein
MPPSVDVHTAATPSPARLTRSGDRVPSVGGGPTSLPRRTSYPDSSRRHHGSSLGRVPSRRNARSRSARPRVWRRFRSGGQGEPLAPDAARHCPRQHHVCRWATGCPNDRFGRTSHQRDGQCQLAPRPGTVTLRAASTFSPLNWAFFGGGEGTRTLGLYIANVWLSVF